MEDQNQKNTEKSKNEAEVHEDYTFFNVMPPVKASSPVIDPSIKVVNNEPILPEKSISANKTKLFAVIGIAILLLGGIGYWVYEKYFTVQKTDVVIHDPKALKPASSDNSHSGQVTVIPQDWLQKYFNVTTCTDAVTCGDNADPDHDGLTNLEEYKFKTDPNNADSDQDGLADGDEIYVFGTSPVDAKTAHDPKYNDADFLKGGYNVKNPDQKLTADQISEITAKMKQYGLHQPTVTTLKNVLTSIYNFTPTGIGAPTPTPTPANATTTTVTKSGTQFDQSPTAKQDRDTQRNNTIKNLGIALVKYYDDKQSVPKTDNFSDMVTAVKPYNRVATRAVDPINEDNFVYAYSSPDGKDFTLSFYSETQNQLIKKHMAEAIADKTASESSQLDNQRIDDLEGIKSALLVYSNKNIAGTQEYVFPAQDKYKTALVPDYISVIPKDPQTNKDYEYRVSETFDTFTLKATLSNPPVGTTGYMCNQDECKYY